ncbi:MAG: hypothetical protein M1817_004235 [Caeruleum heppii]|nr:MAG: hypothetical protein M1817_004235 [Caeruleum heppii]
MAQSMAYRHYCRALSRWPKDFLRPEVSFQKAMQRRIDRRFLGKLDEAANNKEATIVPPSAAVTVNETTELEQVNALYSLLENRYSKKYPVTDSFMHPTSKPSHYDDLLAELDAAPRRSWLASKLNKWKGFLRFS